MLRARLSELKPLIKICGLTTAPAVKLCVDLGVDLLGFIFHKQSPRYVDPAVVRTFDTQDRLRVGVFVTSDIQEILAIMDEAKLDLAQLHGDQGIEVAKAIGPNKVIRVFWPERDQDTPGALEKEMAVWRNGALFYLLDAGKDLGGHGRKIANPTFNSPKPYFLAGGLTVQDFSKLWPSPDRNLWGLDFNSGVETAPGQKDETALRVLAIARSPFRAL
ncbi:MAG: phosphoribosylanthranilate isomerase [Deltaproteobacteria bacterium]|jgi:phosphoribosylanthranilate isomerase|nr:phosphoribosylanthranilate isomerase [Deltaproteobacteria bacterium]